MKDHPLYNAIDLKFIKAVDGIISVHKQLNIKPDNDGSMAAILYPTSRSIISAVRSRTRHIPHLALIQMGKEFDVDMNYFYKDVPFSYQPPSAYMKKFKDSIYQIEYPIPINLVKGQKGTMHSQAGYIIDQSMAFNKVFTSFMMLLDKQQTADFLEIIAKLQQHHKRVIQSLEESLKAFKASHQTEVKRLNEDAKGLREKLDEAILRELSLMRKLLGDNS